MLYLMYIRLTIDLGGTRLIKQYRMKRYRKICVNVLEYIFSLYTLQHYVYIKILLL